MTTRNGISRWMLAGLLAVSLPVGLLAHGGEDHSEPHKKKKAATVEIKGEVLDLSCYMGHGSKGKKHRKCAKTCLVEKHVAAGLLLEDGSVILLVKDHKHEKAFAGVGRLAAEQVVVTGRKVKKGGLKAFMVKSIRKAGK